MTIFGVCEIIFGLVIERLSAKLGRSLFFAISYAFELTALLFCLLWVPNDEPWVPYFIVVFFGISDGLRQPLLSGKSYGYYDNMIFDKEIIKVRKLAKILVNTRNEYLLKYVIIIYGTPPGLSKFYSRLSS